MTIELHPKCRDRIIELISQHLPNVEVENRMFIVRGSAAMLTLADQALSKEEDMRKKLEQYIGDLPLFEFIFGILSRELRETQKYSSKTPLIKLQELEDYRDANKVAERLTDSFCSLPWEYFLAIKFENDFGKLFAKAVKQYSLSDSVSLVTPDEDFKNKFPLSPEVKAKDETFGSILGLGLLSTPPIQKWEEDATYFQIKVNGFIGEYGGTVPLENGVSALKSFCGLSVALRLLKYNYTYKTTPSKAQIFIHRNIKGKWATERTQEIESSISDTFNDLILHDLDGTLKSEEEKIQWMLKSLEMIKYVFSNKKMARRIILAGQWLFDSYCGLNELLSFIQTTVALEILLGKKSISDIMGLGELLRNRCAYLIGNSHKHREKILSDFKKIYDIRSKIVHRGKSRLDLEERILFHRLQWMCRRVIHEEVKLLVKDFKKST